VAHPKRVELLAANQLIGFNEQSCFQRGCIPDAAADEMVKLVIAHAIITGCHRLNALAIAWTDQPRYIGRAHPPARSMRLAAEFGGPGRVEIPER